MARAPIKKIQLKTCCCHNVAGPCDSLDSSTPSDESDTGGTVPGKAESETMTEDEAASAKEAAAASEAMAATTDKAESSAATSEPKEADKGELATEKDDPASTTVTKEKEGEEEMEVDAECSSSGAGNILQVKED